MYSLAVDAFHFAQHVEKYTLILTHKDFTQYIVYSPLALFSSLMRPFALVHVQTHTWFSVLSFNFCLFEQKNGHG